MFKLFLEGGPWFMSVLTILLVALFFAAWKAPRWVKEIGRFALVFGFFSLCLGLRQMFGFISQAESEIAQRIIAGGLNVALIPVLYGMIIDLISIVIRIIQKPRI